MWQYIVSFPFECQSVFGVEFNEKPYHYNTVLCTAYNSFIPETANESVSIFINILYFSTHLNI